LELTDQAVALAGAAGADAQLATALNPRARLRATVSDISGGKEDGYRALGGGGSFRLALPNA
jgi:hypothetical protein